MYVSWKPDPGAKAVDAFSLHWKDTNPYMFPPFSLIGRVLTKLTRDAVATALIITPWWPTAHWYPVLLHLACSCPLLLPQWNKLLSHPQDRTLLHPLRDSMRLIAWHVSVLDLNRRDFLNGLPVMCSNPGVPAPPSSIPWHGSRFVAGVVQNKLIHFTHLVTDQFETENKSYSTINSYRSALSSILPPFERKLLGEHPVIVRLL